MRFNGKSVVVTGASSGMGRSIAESFVKEGATVIAVARRKERLEELEKECGGYEGRLLPFPGDVSRKEVNEAMIDYCIEKTGKLDILVNNAGIMDGFRPVGELTDEILEKVMAVNFFGPAYAMRKAVQVMLKQETKGNIINIASIGGIKGARAGAVYTASKHALVGLTENTAYMYAGKLRCNAICPGGIETEVMNGQEISQFGASRVYAGLDSSIPVGKPQDIADAVLFLASESSAFTTGSVFVIDGAVSCN